MLKLVCFGDSITARKEGSKTPLLTSMLSEQLTGFKVVNAGVPGDNTIDALERIDSDVLIHQPDLVTVLFGANDAAFHKTIELELYKNNLVEMISKLGSNKTILLSAAPVDELRQNARSNLVLRKYAAVVEEVSLETGSHYIDFFNSLLSRDDYQQILKGQENDGLHFGKVGYEILSELIAEKVKEVIRGR
ncbi:GDSL-type esterase/lipase family protein [Bacillus sp. AK128]